ncbi:MAG: hypothetical protein WCO92_04110, partial [Verrucomicrobiota bacterium]
MLHLQLQLQKLASYFFLFQKRKKGVLLFCLFFLAAFIDGRAQSDTNISGSITNIGTNSYSNVYVGSNSSGNTYNILSSTSLVNISTNLWVGCGGGVGGANSNSLVISNGGIVSDVNGLIAISNASNNSVLVTGSSSLWSNSGSVQMGEAASVSNTITVSAGGALVSSNVTIGIDTTASNNSVLITGSGSQWS